MTIIDTFWFKKSQLFLYFPLNTFISQDLLLKYFFFADPHPPPHWTVNFPIKSRGQSNPLKILGSILHTEIKTYGFTPRNRYLESQKRTFSGSESAENGPKTGSLQPTFFKHVPRFLGVPKFETCT